MVKIRLTRMGSKGRPFYRIVVANADSPRDGKTIDQIGYYDPMTDPSTIKLDVEKAALWVKRGAQPTDRVADILKKHGVYDHIQAEKTGAAAG